LQSAGCVWLKPNQNLYLRFLLMTRKSNSTPTFCVTDIAWKAVAGSDPIPEEIGRVAERPVGLYRVIVARGEAKQVTQSYAVNPIAVRGVGPYQGAAGKG